MIEKFAQADKFAQRVGITLMEAHKGYAKAKVTIGEEHLNSVGTVHGGLLFTLADFVFAVACNSYGTIAVAIHASISYFQGAKHGVLYATAQEISLQHKLSDYLIEIKDEENNLIALFQGMAYRKKDEYIVRDKKYTDN